MSMHGRRAISLNRRLAPPIIPKLTEISGLGISIKKEIGIGDGLQFSSLPENYFRACGKKLLDISMPWFFDHNPFVVRDSKEVPSKVIELWNFSPTQYQWPNPRKEDEPRVYLSNAEIWTALLDIPCSLTRPRLYQFEHYPFFKRTKILLQTNGKSHGLMPLNVIEHVIFKYGGSGHLWHIGPRSPDLDLIYPLPQCETPTLWDLAKELSEARMVIGMDSGPSWIASCYPDVDVKIVRSRPLPDAFKTWIPLSIDNIHSMWDDRCRKIYNPTDVDIGFTWSYKRI